LTQKEFEKRNVQVKRKIEDFYGQNLCETLEICEKCCFSHGFLY